MDIHGRPMVQRVWEQACQSAAARVVIATDDERIADVASGFGAEVCMTDPAHPSGTDRLEEVVRILGLDDDHVVVNVQGDEPLIPPGVIDQVAANLVANPVAAIATLCEPIASAEDLRNPNIVKAVTDARGMALYFSRAPVPWPREAFADETASLPGDGSWSRHIGIYAYRCRFLHDYVSWPPAPQERLEQLEQLRALHNGAGIHVDEAGETVPPGVDTQGDLEHVRTLLSRSDP
jgi:3-deoxy-manno-octulosonate cytidylyltransferase (CMP-KDO synthetase)